jgi:hypothetical protein
VTDTLLCLHLLSAAALFSAIFAFSALMLGARMEPGAVTFALVLSQIGMVGVLVFGVALAIDVDGTELWDVWVLIAIALWLGAGGTAGQVLAAYKESGGTGGTIPRNVATAHWIHVALVLLLLADMVWKPWA